MTVVDGIYGFFGEYRFLSNFWYSEVTLDGESYPSVEHAYQAAKTLDPKLRRDFRFSIFYDGDQPIEKTPTCGQAKRMGSKLELREDWEEVKVGIMKNLVSQKFTNDRKLGDLLIRTEILYLEETNHWNDTFWGVCNGKGKNVLGNILMEVRENLVQARELEESYKF